MPCQALHKDRWDQPRGHFRPLRNLLEDRVLRRAWTASRLAGSLRIPVEKTSTDYGGLQEASAQKRPHGHSSPRKCLLSTARRISKASWRTSITTVIIFRNPGRLRRPGVGAETASTEEQVLVAHISHLPTELRQRLAARQLTGRLSSSLAYGWLMPRAGSAPGAEAWRSSEPRSTTHPSDYPTRQRQGCCGESVQSDVRHWVLQCRCGTEDLWECDIRQKPSTQPAGEEQYLGECL
jgi:hypothetical protein